MNLEDGFLQILTDFSTGYGEWADRPEDWEDSQRDDGFSDELAAWKVLDLNGDGSSDLAFMDSGQPGETGPFTLVGLLSDASGGWTAVPSSSPSVDPGSLGPLALWRGARLDGSGKSALMSPLPVDEGNAGGQELHGVRLAGLELTDDNHDWRWVGGDAVGASPDPPIDWQMVDEDGYGFDSAVGTAVTDTGVSEQVISSARSDDLMTVLRSPLGGTVSLEYRPASAWTQSGESDDRCYVPAGFVSPTLWREVLQAGHGAPPTIYEFGYGCPQYSAATRGLADWAETTVTREGTRFLGPVTVEKHNRLGIDGLTQTISQTSIPAAVSVDLLPDYLASNPQTERRTTTWTYAPIPDGPAALDEVRSERDDDCIHSSCVTTTRDLSYDGFGDVVGEAEHLIEPDGVAHMRRDVRTTYAPPNEQQYIVSLPHAQTTLGMHGKTLAETRYCYDGPKCGSAPSQGLVTKISQLDSTDRPHWPSTSIRYDAHGNPVSITDPDGHQQRFAYDPTDPTLTTKICTKLGGCEEVSWDHTLGVATSVHDPGGLTTRLQHDPLGRLTGSVSPTGASESISYISAKNGEELLDRVSSGAHSAIWTRSLLDGFGRTYQTRRSSGGPSGSPSVQDATFADSTGSAIATSPWHLAQDPTPAATRTSFDGFGRSVHETRPAMDDVTWSYGISETRSAGAVLTTAAAAGGTSMTTATNGWGQMRSQTLASGSTRAMRTYQYDDLGDLLQDSSTGGYTETLRYDSLGRVTSERDRDRGRTTWAYDPMGNVTREIDARHVRTMFRYDALGRMIMR